ncbi:chemotaxis protein CheV [Reinekea marinisedimentorum]|uniref:Two-component system chemotaxis response regulator CheV n=1 Tax=Reinekea marinisedimentorum TaxID=230495 RepID=A0A4R3I4C2_9GAMM|nr:chemotaxis protein CheV [Reinekea marinisedimentorum]TCS39923.1 two-component system chemotaxis response regulator CheV [Reinekea marinisedimentorum]
MAGVMESVNQRTQLVGQNRLELLLFRLEGKQIYGINVFKVKEVLQCPKLTNLPQSSSVVRGVAHIRGGTLPILDLSLATGNPPIQDLENKFVIITEYNIRVQGFLVNGVERIINMNWEDIQPPPKGTGHEHYLTAVTKYKDELVEIIDVEKILAEVSPVNDDLSDDIITEEVAASAPQIEVMIADDSKIARKQISKTLEKVGFVVRQFNDGKEAHDHLMDLLEQGINPADKYPILISDIEMPEMDGYTLTAEIRSNPRLKDLYVVLHTSLSGVFNKAMVSKVGADDFLAKFQPDLLGKMVIDRVVSLGLTAPQTPSEESK